MFTRRSLAGLAIVCLVAGTSVGIDDVFAQRPFPFRVHDPFYRSETARRTFYDGFAVTGEVSYRAAGGVQSDGLQAASADPLGLSARLDYQLAPRLDLNVYWDASGTNTGRTVFISWVGLKYYWTVENTDYSLRLAVDPASDGRVGFPQMDVAFLSTKALSPLILNDIAVGMRHVRMGYQQYVPAEQSEDAEPAFINTQALGLELHGMWTYNVIFDPASSSVFLSLVGEGGQYTLLEVSRVGGASRDSLDTRPGEPISASEYRGGVAWVRSGIQYNRPSYQLIPFFGFPLKQWAFTDDIRRETPRMQLGFRLMLR
jgi:hypothetical protein